MIDFFARRASGLSRIAVVGLVGLCAAAVPAVSRADDATAAIVESVAKSVGARDRMLSLVVTANVKPGMVGRFLETASSIAPATRAEPGCIEFSWHRSVENPNQFVLFEKWADVNVLAAHLRRSYIQAAFKVYEQTLTEPLKVQIFHPY
jgi:quinol monooxygenase YgiN